jgi:DNA invertase Pin-like site-specific DNA recombinase
MSQKERPIALTYSRVSGADDPRTLSLDSQEEEQVRLLESRGYHVPMELRLREHFTGMESIYERPVLVRARELVTSGKVNAFGCYDTDRLARDPKDLVTVVSSNRQHKVETIFVKMDHETASRVGEMLLYMQGFASAVEYDRIRDRTMRARMKILAAGKWYGGGVPKFGYVWNKDARTRTENPDTGPIVRRIFVLVGDENLSAVAVAKLLDEEGVPAPSVFAGRQFKDGRVPHWTPATVMMIIKDHTYIGEVYARTYMPTGERKPNGKRKMVKRPKDERAKLEDHGTEPLVSRELFDRANAVLARYRSRRGTPVQRKGDTHLLAGYIWCAVCGNRMSPETSKGKKPGNASRRHYHCIGNHQNMRTQNGCNANIGALWVERAAWEGVCNVLDEGFLDRELERVGTGGTEKLLRKDLKEAEARKKKLELAIKGVLDAQSRDYRSASVRDALQSKLDELDREIGLADQQIADLKEKLVPFADLAKTRAALKGRVERFRERARSGDLTLAQKREVLEYLGIRVFAAAKGVCRVEASIPVDGCGNSGTTTYGISSVPTSSRLTIALA